MEKTTLTAGQLLAASAAPVFYVDLSLVRERILVDMSTREIKIPGGIKRFGIQYDHLAEKIVFEADRYVDGEDLAAHTVAIHWENGGNSGIFPVTNIDLSEAGKILIQWVISGNMTQNAAALEFAIHFYSIVDGGFTYHLSTYPASGKIDKGLNAPQQGSANITPDEIEQYIRKMDDLRREMEELLSKKKKSS